MRYLGGKSRLAKQFAPILAEALAEYDGAFVEPFVGGFNVIPALRGSVDQAVCADNHPGLINLYNALLGGWEPPESISREEYGRLKEDRGIDALSTFVSFACSFGGKEWGGYASGEGRNFCAESRRAVFRKFSDLPRCLFLRSDYRDLPDVWPAVYYCDPPYAGTTGYRTGDFDSPSFFRWCEERVASGNRVFVSEFSAPDHWSVVWEKPRKVSVSIDSYKTKTDRLYEVRVR